MLKEDTEENQTTQEPNVCIPESSYTKEMQYCRENGEQAAYSRVVAYIQACAGKAFVKRSDKADIYLELARKIEELAKLEKDGIADFAERHNKNNKVLL